MYVLRPPVQFYQDTEFALRVQMLGHLQIATKRIRKLNLSRCATFGLEQLW